MHFHVRIILHHLGILLSHQDRFSKVRYSYIKIPYSSICHDYGVNAEEIWTNGYWFYTAAYGEICDGGKGTKKSPPGNIAKWIIS